MITYPRALPSRRAQEERRPAQKLQQSFSSVGSHFTRCLSHSLTGGRDRITRLGNSNLRLIYSCGRLLRDYLAVPIVHKHVDSDFISFVVHHFSLISYYFDPRIEINGSMICKTRFIDKSFLTHPRHC